jgi:hypothetical protein
LVTPLKLIYSSTQVSDVLVFTVWCKLIKFIFQVFPLFILKYLRASRLTLFRLSPFI